MEDELPEGFIWCNHPTFGRRYFKASTALKANWQRSTQWTPEPKAEKPPIAKIDPIEETETPEPKTEKSKGGRPKKLQTADSI